MVQVIAWCRLATNHYPSQCLPSSVSSHGVTSHNELSRCLKSVVIYVIDGFVFSHRYCYMSCELIDVRDHNRQYIIQNSVGPPFTKRISWNLEATRSGIKILESFWNLTGVSAALLPRHISNFRAIPQCYTHISLLPDFASFGYNLSYHFTNKCPGVRYSRLWRDFVSGTNGEIECLFLGSYILQNTEVTCACTLGLI